MKDIMLNMLELIIRFVSVNYKKSKFWVAVSALSLIAAWFFSTSCTVSFQVAKKNSRQDKVRSEQSTKVDSVQVSNSLNR